MPETPRPVLLARARRHVAGLVAGRPGRLGPRHAVLVAVLVVCLPVLLLGGCGSDPVRQYAPSIGTNERVPGMDALGFAVVTDGHGAGTLVGTLLNTADDPDALVSAAVTAERATVDAVLTDGAVALPPGETVPMARSNAVALRSESFPVGFFVELRLTFRNSPPVHMLVPVEPQRGPYAEIEVVAPPDGDVSP